MIHQVQIVMIQYQIVYIYKEYIFLKIENNFTGFEFEAIKPLLTEIGISEEEKIKIFKEGDKKLELKFLIYVLKLKNDRIYVGRTT